MKNKTLGMFLMWTLAVAILTYFVNESLSGVLYLANWVFVFMAGARLVSMKK